MRQVTLTILFLFIVLIGYSQDLLFRNYPRNQVLASPFNRTGKPSFRDLHITDIPDLSSLYIQQNLPNRSPEDLIYYDGYRWKTFDRAYEMNSVLMTVLDGAGRPRLKWVSDTAFSTIISPVLPVDTANHLINGFGVLSFDYNVTADDTVSVDTNIMATVYYVDSKMDTYKEQLSAPKTVFNLDFTLTDNTTVSYNGSEVNDVQWTGVGTNTLTLYLDTKQYDYLIVKQ